MDTVAPSVALISPLNGSNVSGSVAISGNPSDNVGVVRLRFYADGRQLGTRTASPWKWNWDTSAASKGTHSVFVRAEDAAGNATSTVPVNVTVK